MLEAVARSAADEHDVRVRRVAVDEEIAVRAILILADAALGQRGIAQQREAAVAEGDDVGQCGIGRAARLGVGVDQGPMRIARELDPAALEVGKAVIQIAAVEVGPAGHRGAGETRVAGGRGEEEHLLPRGEDAVGEELGEELAEPRAEREHEAVGGEGVASR